MMPWSIHESGGNPTHAEDHSLLDGSGSNRAPRSTYTHMKLMSKFFTGSFQMGQTNNSNIKVFSSLNCVQQAGMILNMENTSKNIDVNFSGNYTSPPPSGMVLAKLNGENPARFQVAMGAEETRVIIFDLCGKKMEEYVYNRSMVNTSWVPESNNYQYVGMYRCSCINIKYY